MQSQLQSCGAFPAAVIGSADIIDESILSVDIKNGEVKNSDLATDAVTGAKIQNLSFKTSDLGDRIVTSGKIKDGTIQRQDIAKGLLPVDARAIIFGPCFIDVSPENSAFGGASCPAPGTKNGDHTVATLNHQFGDRVALLEVHSSEDCGVEDPNETCWIQYHYQYLGELPPSGSRITLDYMAWR